MRAGATAGTGFLFAVLWFDLMFDVQVLQGGDDEAVDSIARYYRRVTTEARMGRFIAVVMVATLGCLVAEVLGDDVTQWVAVASLILAAIPIGVAATRTVRRAVRLGAQDVAPAHQRAMARLILREHLFCLPCVAAVLVLQLALA